MRIIKDKQIVEDNWQRLATIEAGQSLPEGDVIIPFDYWLDNSDSLRDRKGKTAICINGDHTIQEVAKVADQFDLIALDFPVFKDGRCYSHARLLKDRYAYRGELRAVGDVLRDQLFFMNRCGIDSFQLREDKDFEDALKAFDDFTVTYQTATDGAPPIYRVR